MAPAFPPMANEKRRPPAQSPSRSGRNRSKQKELPKGSPLVLGSVAALWEKSPHFPTNGKPGTRIKSCASRPNLHESHPTKPIGSVALCLRVLRAIGVPTSIVEEFKNRQQHNPMQYDVIRATEIEELIAKVNAAIKKGFVPLGGVEITNVTQARPQPAFAFMQAVVKES